MVFDYKYGVNIKSKIQIMVSFNKKKLMIHTESKKHLV